MPVIVAGRGACLPRKTPPQTRLADLVSVPWTSNREHDASISEIRYLLHKVANGCTLPGVPHTTHRVAALVGDRMWATREFGIPWPGHWTEGGG
jgi:hypothetical protein